MKLNRFYVYVYLDVSKPGSYIYDEYEFRFEPFYVGKGTGKRFEVHLKLDGNVNREKQKRIRSLLEKNLKPEIFLIKNLEEFQAFNLERFLINRIGQMVYDTGVLTNLIDGGSGKSLPEVSKKLISDIKKQWHKENKDKVKENGLKISRSLRDRYKQGSLVNGFKGRIHGNDSRKLIGSKTSITSKGKKNSQFGSVWIYNKEQKLNKKISKSEVEKYLISGWVLGRKIKI